MSGALAFVVEPEGYDQYGIYGVFLRLADACECAYKHRVHLISVFDLETGNELGEIMRRNLKTRTWETSGIRVVPGSSPNA